jgi:hypothetical protein
VAKDKEINAAEAAAAKQAIGETGTFKLPKDGAPPERVGELPKGPAPPGVEDAKRDMADGALLSDLDEMKQRAIKIQAYRDDEARILEAVKAEAGPEEPLVPKNYGVFGDLDTVFELLHEQVGPWNRNEHKVVPIREFVVFNVKPSGKGDGGYVPDYSRPDIRATKEVLDRLVHKEKAMRPLLIRRTG